MVIWLLVSGEAQMDAIEHAVALEVPHVPVVENADFNRRIEPSPKWSSQSPFAATVPQVVPPVAAVAGQ